MSPLLTLIEYFTIVLEVACVLDFAVIFEPLDDFACGHVLAKIDFDFAYYDVGIPFLLLTHLHAPFPFGFR